MANGFFILNFSPTCSISPTSDNFNAMQMVMNELNSDFATFPLSLYTTFMLSLSILSPSSNYFGQSVVSQFAVVLYITSILFISILLVNLLIRIMGQRVTEITEQRDTLMKLQVISVIEMSENRRLVEFWI